MCCFKASQLVVNAFDSTKKCFENLLGTKFDSCNQRNTHLGMKKHCTAGLQFTRLDSTKKGKSVVISQCCEAVVSKLVKLETSCTMILAQMESVLC